MDQNWSKLGPKPLWMFVEQSLALPGPANYAVCRTAPGTTGHLIRDGCGLCNKEPVILTAIFVVEPSENIKEYNAII